MESKSPMTIIYGFLVLLFNMYIFLLKTFCVTPYYFYVVYMYAFMNLLYGQYTHNIHGRRHVSGTVMSCKGTVIKWLQT